jgi:calcium/calmodulin-dependent protein kinase I
VFEKGRKLGSGHFATVFVAKRKLDKKVFAVKVINKISLSEDEKALLREEIAILKLVHHPNIIGTEQIMEGKNSINIVTELVRGGDLFAHIAGRKTLSEEEAYTLYLPVISAVEYLHKMGIIHRDIKPENILCENGFHNVKIADFGLGKLVRPNTVLERKCGTPSYVAPEILDGKLGYGKPADMWSVGVVMYLTLRGKLPFRGETDKEITHAILNEPAQFNDSRWRLRSNELIAFVKLLLSKIPSERLTASEALQHEWMKKTYNEINGVTDEGKIEMTDRQENGEQKESEEDKMSTEELKSKLIEVREKNQQLREELTNGEILEQKIRNMLKRREEKE